MISAVDAEVPRVEIWSIPGRIPVISSIFSLTADKARIIDFSPVLTIGIAGFLGSHLADRFISLGHKVSGNDTLIGGYIDNVPKDAIFYKIDL